MYVFSFTIFRHFSSMVFYRYKSTPREIAYLRVSKLISLLSPIKCHFLCNVLALMCFSIVYVCAAYI